MIDHGEKILTPFSKTDWVNRILVRIKKIWTTELLNLT